MMIITDPCDALALAEQRGRRLRAEAAAERLRGRSAARRKLAASLRRVADRLDAAPHVCAPTSIRMGEGR